VEDAALTARLESGLDPDAPANLFWDAKAATASGAEFRVADFVSDGRVRLTMPEAATADAFLAAVQDADMQVETGAAALMSYSVGGLRGETSLKSADGSVSGPIELALMEAAGPQGRAGAMEAAGEGSWTAEGGVSFEGAVRLANAALDDAASEGALRRLAFPAPLTAHGESLQQALHRALSDFGAEARLRATLSEKGATIHSRDPASLKAASGLAFEVTPPAQGGDWLVVDASGIRLAGAVSLNGGGAPRASAEITELRAGAGGFELTTGALRVSPWLVSDVRFGADVDQLSVSSGADKLSVNGSGDLSLSGNVFGLKLSPSRLSGGLQVTNDTDGLRVEPDGYPCLSFDTEGVELGSVGFQPAVLKLCPRGGAYMKPGFGKAAGSAVLGDVDWPFVSKSVTGTLGLKDARIDWSARKGFALTLSSPKLNLPLDIGDHTLIIDAARPDVGISTARGRSPKIVATLNDTVFGGTLIPAKVSAGEITLDGVLGSGGLSGDLAGNDVLIRDFRDDPVYQPLLSDLTGRMDEWQLALSGPLRLQASGRPVGDISADIDVLSLNGTAHVETRPLDFSKGGLQPVMLSERLRGVYTDAAGHMEAVSDVVITGGKMTGTAGVTVENFGFQTTRLGRVENVSGHVEFADLFSLTTAPSQVLTIGAMDPGVPLKNGRIVFGFSEGRVLAVESAAFPFSGGTLALSPFDWTLGADAQHVEVTADAIDLEELVRILKLPKIEAQGTVSGRFPIDVERSKVLVRNARLFADDEGGRVAYLGDAADSAAESDPNVRLAFEALKDFDFTVLEVGLDGNIADRVKITLKLAGKSRNDITYGINANIVKGQPFEFNIGVDTALAELFRSSQFYTNQQTITDFVVEEVLADKGLKKAEDE